ncbi:Averantin oxidoreductase [Madurella fahalii]|uniref:Averantin oxidoreductase n=1 Tax=Madurella fahalii TaxID=1157608 RepID=A0ABQ0G4A8_9PEZI
MVASGRLLQWLQAQHARYGPIVRVGPDRLSFIQPQAWKDIYGHRSGGKQTNIKDPRFYDDMDTGGHRNVLTERDGPEHGRVRRIFSHAFSDKALKEQQPLLNNYVDQLVSNIRQAVDNNPHHTFDAVKLYNFTTFDIMADLTFGESLGMLRTSSYTDWVRNIFNSTRILAISTIWREYGWLNTLYKLLEPPFMRRASEVHRAHSVDRVKRRLEKGDRTDNHKDIWTLVLSQPEGKGLTPEKMHSNAVIFMLAGTETTATLLSGLTYYLLRNPDKMRKLVQEIRGAIPCEDDFTLENLQRLKYLGACIEEGLRLYPPVPVPLWRVTPREGTTICDEYIPGGVRVAVSSFIAFKSPLNFKDADSFVPERWIPGSGYDDDHREVVQPFSVGPRNCLGKNLAYHEMRLILAKLLWNFDMTLCPQSEGWQDQLSFILWDKSPLLVKIKMHSESETSHSPQNA